MNQPRIELILTGEELVTGKVADSNGRFLAVGLSRMGLPCLRVTLVGDGEDEIGNAAREALSRSNLVVVSGGLGPTGDDVTRQALATALNLPLVTLEALPDHRPGAVPDGAVQMANPQGSAAGFWIETAAVTLAALPGVPWELTAMWPELERRIRARFPDRVHYARTLRTVGRMEKELDRIVGDALSGMDDVSLGVTANPLAVDLHITATTDAALKKAVSRVHTALGDVIYAEGDTSLAAVVGDLLRAGGQTVATAESCTGGAICAALTAVPGASDYVDRGIVSYANAAKTQALGVPEALIKAHGAVSEPVARSMAELLRGAAHVDITLSVTGIAGPTGGTKEKPVGTVYMAVSTPEGTVCYRFVHAGDRARFVQRTVYRGLDLIRRYAQGGITALERVADSAGSPAKK